MHSISPENTAGHKINTTGSGHYYLMPDLQQLVCSPSLVRLLNLGSVPDYNSLLGTFHSEDRKIVEELFTTSAAYETFKVSVRRAANDLPVPKITVRGTVMIDHLGNRVITGKIDPEIKFSSPENRQAIFDSITNNAAAGLWLADRDGQLIYLNSKMSDWAREYATDTDGRYWLEALLEPDRTKVKEQYYTAISTRGHFECVFRIRKPDGIIAWYRAAGDPYFDEQNQFQGLAGYCLDISEQTEAVRELKISETRFRTLVEQAPVATCLFTGPDMNIDIANEKMIAMWGKSATVLGLPLHKAVPELVGQPFLDILKHVYNSGETYSARGELAKISVGNELQDFYFDFTYKPIYNADGEIYGIMDMAVDVTEQVKTTKQLKESEARFKSLILEAPFPTGVYRGRELIIEMANPEMIKVWGKGAGVIGLPLDLALPELRDQPFLQILDNVYTTGETYNTQESKVDLVVDNVLQTFYFNFTYKPLLDPNGNVYAIFNMAVDVTAQVTARHKLEFAEYSLRMAIELAELGTWNLDLNTGEMYLSPRLMDWLGVSPENPITIDRAHASVKEADKIRLQNLFTTLIESPQSGVSDIIFTVGTVNGRPERIIQSQARSLVNNEGVPYKISGTSRDITAQKRTEHALELQVQQRTEELQNVNEELTATNEELYEINRRLTYSNEELAQYAYVASHDLQEPLRKIRMFTDMLAKKQNQPGDKEELVIKINKSAQRMSLLIENLLEFSRLLNSDRLFIPVDLNIVAAEVKSDFELMIVEKGAILSIGELPIVQAIGLQMNQLFYNLVSNALKFSRAGISPVITISARALSSAEAKAYITTPVHNGEYYHIEVADNGIGIDSQYSDQIFEVFKRLHRKEIYPGSGIGLALCRRIVTNHSGYIFLESAAGVGTVFHILLPARPE